MNKLFALIVFITLVGCAEKKPLTAEQQWHGYCTSIGNAANTIMFDRQNGIEKTAALEHANKIEDDITRNFILEIIAQVYALPIEEINADVDAAREKVRAQFTEKCIATPHDKMPDYKPF